MKAVIQTVHDARVTVDNNIVGQIKDGMLIYFGVAKNDEERDVIPFFDKILKMRIFKDENQRMNLNLKSVNGSILLVSQFTLETNIYAGNRPSLDSAAPGEKAKIFYEKAIKYLTGYMTESEFWNGKNLSTNRWLTWFFEKPQKLSSYPIITVRVVAAT